MAELVDAKDLKSFELFKARIGSNPIIPIYLDEQDLERFLSKIKFGAKEECWLWLGNKIGKRKKGQFNYRFDGISKVIYASRLMYYLVNGKFNKELMVCHSCDNASCVNPSHLWLGTALDNNKDRDNKGRAIVLKGKQVGTSKLTEDNIKFIRENYHKYTNKQLAKMLNLSDAVICRAFHKLSWKHI